MKKIHLMVTVAAIIGGFTGCNNSTDEAKQDAENLTQYVDSVENAAPVYTVANWTAIDNGYRERASKAEKTIAAMEAEDKAKTEASKAKYATLKASYEVQLKEKAAPDYRLVLRNRLFGEGKIGADMKFDFVTADNAYTVYKNFVDAVDNNKDNYTREDWDEIKVLYEALDTRKNAIEKDLASNDNLKIAKQKIRFASIKSFHRGGSKITENEEAKQ